MAPIFLSINWGQTQTTFLLNKVPEHDYIFAQVKLNCCQSRFKLLYLNDFFY